MNESSPRATLVRMLTEQPRRLTRRVGAWTRQPADAEDLAQEIVVRALRGVDTLESEDEPLVCAWLDSVARNAAYNALRGARGREFRPVDEADLPSEPSAERAALGLLTWRRLVAAVGDLPAPLAEVLMLRVIEGLSGREVARQLGISEVAVRGRLHRAWAELRASVPGVSYSALSHIRLLRSVVTRR